MIVGGLDLSLTKIGAARTHPDRSSMFVETLRPIGKGVPRLQSALTLVVRALKGVDVVAIEGYSYGSVLDSKTGERRASRGHAIGELTGVVKLGLQQLKPPPPIAIIAPTTLKLFAAGHGHADKDRMLLAAKSLLGYGRGSYDEADALWLCQMAIHHYGLPGMVDLPDKNLAALEGVQWPPRPFHAREPDLEF